MFYKERIDRIFELSKKGGEEDADAMHWYKNRIELEKGDFLSMVLGAYYAFLPVFIVLFILLYLSRPW